jgi:apolipoprotein N-acyltransferase
MDLHHKRVSRFADMVTLSSGWRRRGIAFAAGSIGVLALPPLGLFPLLIVTMTISVWLIDGCVGQVQAKSVFKSRLSAALEAAKIGWWLGFGYFLAGLWWLGAAFLVEADQFAWALPLGVIGLPAALAFFTALGFAASRLLWCNNSLRILALAIGLGACEALRSVLFTGFPWNNFGMALGGNLILSQSASLVGLHGLTLLAIALAAAPALIADRQSRRATFFVASLVFLSIGAFGAVRLSLNATSFDDKVRLRIMQPNLPQDDKFRADAMPEILTRYIELSSRATDQRPDGIVGVTHLVWPESPFPVVLARDAQALQRIGDLLAPRTTLITGAIRIEAPPNARPKYFNSIQVLQPGGVIVDSYDKTHLVPFGEYFPFRRIFDALGLRQFVHVPGGFEPGAARKLLLAPGLPPAAPLICYEAIFSGAVAPDGSRSAGASVLLNVTNDGWFGNTHGPYQHFAQARLRAIEEGLPLIRAANTGISAIIDPYGRVLESLPLGVAGVLDGRLPNVAPATIFSRSPILPPLMIWLSFLLMIGLFGRERSARV